MIFRGPYTEVEIPAVSLTEFVFGRAREHADKPALVEGTSGRTLSYARLVEAIDRAAASLAARGFTKGDVLAVFSPNLLEYAVAFHAVARSAARRRPSTRSTPPRRSAANSATRVRVSS